MSDRSSLKIIFFLLSFFLLIICAEKKVFSETLEPKALFEKRCSRCHSLDKTNRNESADFWTSTVQKMKKKFFSGISKEDAAVITDYLIKTKGLPESVPAPAADIPSDK
jgi:hypothetical protein